MPEHKHFSGLVFFWFCHGPAAYIDGSSLTSSPLPVPSELNKCMWFYRSNVVVAAERGEEWSVDSFFLPPFKSIPCCVISMDLPSLERNTAPASLLRYSILSSCGEWTTSHHREHMDFAWIEERFVWVTNDLWVYSEEPLGAKNKVTGTSVSWHFLKHQYCNTVHWMALLNLLYNMEDLAATCLTIIKGQMLCIYIYMYIFIWICKPKQSSINCFHSKKFKLGPVPRVVLSCSQVSGIQKHKSWRCWITNCYEQVWICLKG